MSKNRVFILLGLLVVVGLMTGCYRSVNEPVTPTSAAGAQAVEPGEEGENAPDMGTAIANSQLATQAAELTQPAPTMEPTQPPPPTATPTVAPAATVPGTPAPTVAPTVPQPTQPPSPTGPVTHVVQRGENLFRIAQRYGTTVQAVASANGIANPSLVYVGQELTIPSGSGSSQPPSPSGSTTYVVQRGDNLFRIALRYNLSYIYLAQYNGISNPSSIYVGQVLRIPPR